MPGDQSNQIEMLTHDGPFSGKIPLIMDIIRRGNAETQRLLAEWLRATLDTHPDRETTHVLLLALARVEATLTEEEFRGFLQLALAFYDGVTASLRDDDLLLAIANHATTSQREIYFPELVPLTQGEGVLRDAAMEASIRLVATTESADVRSRLATGLRPRGQEVELLQRAVSRRRKA